MKKFLAAITVPIVLILALATTFGAVAQEQATFPPAISQAQIQDVLSRYDRAVAARLPASPVYEPGASYIKTSLWFQSNPQTVADKFVEQAAIFGSSYEAFVRSHDGGYSVAMFFASGAQLAQPIPSDSPFWTFDEQAIMERAFLGKTWRGNATAGDPVDLGEMAKRVAYLDKIKAHPRYACIPAPTLGMLVFTKVFHAADPYAMKTGWGSQEYVAAPAFCGLTPAEAVKNVLAAGAEK